MTSWTGQDRSTTGLHQFDYEYFFYQNLQTGEYIPWLAKSYEYNADFTSLTVKLRDGVTWNDGQPFTADDVVFTYDLTEQESEAGLGGASQRSGQVGRKGRCPHRQVQPDDAQSALPHFSARLSPRSASGAAHDSAQAHLGGAGPANLQEQPPVWHRSLQAEGRQLRRAVTWERRDDWWGTKVWGITPGPKTIQLVNLGAETNVAFALANNEIDTPFIGILSAGSFLEVARAQSQCERLV